MKNSIRILLVCLISTTNSMACGWYPFGEEIRFSLMNPAVFDDGGMSPYYYTSNDYGYNFQSTAENDPNIALWSKYCNGKVDAKSIYRAIYELEIAEINSGHSTNKMIIYLRSTDREALEYVLFAKSCSEWNESDYGWEVDNNAKVSRNKKMLEALKRSEKVESKEIKKRYRFLAVRLAYYNNDNDKLRAIYDKSFSKIPSDAIDYWALYFKSTTEGSSAEKNFNLAQVFVNAPGKRFGALTHFSSKISMDDVLKFAKTDTERANIYAIYAVRNRGRGLLTLKKVQQLDPNHPLLDFLLIREVNKLEDWILTPRYTNFDPTMDVRRESYGESNELIQERIKDDEKYGREVAEWMKSVKSSAKNTTWNIAEAYLSGISGNNSAFENLVNSKNYDEPTRNLVNQLKLLFKVRADANKALTLADQKLLMNSKQSNYNLFLFGVSREYEFQKQFDIAAALFSQLNRASNSFDDDVANSDYYEYNNEVTWRSATGKQTLASDFYYSWFLYLDAEYSPKELQSVIDFAETKFTETTPFNSWQRQYLWKDINKLYDLLGTKHLRQNEMDHAIAAFEKVGGDLWKTDPYTTYLNANPFHADFYSGHKPSDFDTVTYTKLEIAKLYKSYLEKAENPNTRNRAYYYFLVANCELNMSHHGNSWMMRRYFWTSAMNPDNLEDADDYFRLKRARDFYQKASDVSSEKDVKALCLRMIGRCEKHQLYFDAPDSWAYDYDRHGGYISYFFKKNQSYKKLKLEFPEEADDLLSNCYSFERYFAKLEN